MQTESRSERGREFPSTHWSQLLNGPANAPEARRAALERLAQGYWRPIRAYIRTNWSASEQDALDLTQDFFLWMMETDFLSRARPEGGRFRGFVKAALKHYLCDDVRRRRSLKRGGGQAILPLGNRSGNGAALQVADPAGKSPEEILDEAWRRELLERACEILERRCAASGKTVRFQVFRDYCLSPEPDTDYRALAARYGLPVEEVSNSLRDARKQFGEVLMDLVAETVCDPGDLAREYEALFGKGHP